MQFVWLGYRPIWSPAKAAWEDRSRRLPLIAVHRLRWWKAQRPRAGPDPKARGARHVGIPNRNPESRAPPPAFHCRHPLPAALHCRGPPPPALHRSHRLHLVLYCSCRMQPPLRCSRHSCRHPMHLTLNPRSQSTCYRRLDPKVVALHQHRCVPLCRVSLLRLSEWVSRHPSPGNESASRMDVPCFAHRAGALVAPFVERDGVNGSMCKPPTPLLLYHFWYKYPKWPLTSGSFFF